LFSLWFFFMVMRGQDLFQGSLGLVPVSSGSYNARMWSSYQSAGAYVALMLAQLRLG